METDAFTPTLIELSSFVLLKTGTPAEFGLLSHWPRTASLYRPGPCQKHSWFTSTLLTVVCRVPEHLESKRQNYFRKEKR
jgi:hypothetical protein